MSVDLKAPDVAHECFVRVANGETMAAIANRFGTSGTVISKKVLKVYRRLRHPSYHLPAEPVISPEDGLPVGEAIKRNKDVYLARLVGLRHAEGMIGECPGNWFTPLPAPEFMDVEWTPEKDSLLGTMSDASLAKMLACRTSLVRARRLKLRINSYAGGGCDRHA